MRVGACFVLVCRFVCRDWCMGFDVRVGVSVLMCVDWCVEVGVRGLVCVG